MAGDTLAVLEPVLKEQWDAQNRMIRACGRVRPLLNMFESKSAKKGDFDIRKQNGVGGRNLTVLVPVQTGFNQAGGIVAEGGALPAAAADSFAQLAWPTYKFMAPIEFTLEARLATESNELSFARETAFAIQSKEESSAQRLAAMIQVDGTGALAQIVTGATATSFVVDNPGVRLMQRNQYIDVWTLKALGSQEVEGAASADDIYIVDLDPSTNTMYLNASVTVSTDSWIFVSGSPRIEVMGVMGIISDGNDGGPTSVAGVNRSTQANGYVRATVNDYAGEPFSDDTVQTLLDSLELRDYGGDAGDDYGEGEMQVPKNLLLADLETRRYFVQVALSARRIMDTTMAMGAKVVTYDWFGKQVGFCWDQMAWPGRLQAMNTKSLAWYYAQEWAWWDDGGSIFEKNLLGDGSASVIAYYWSVLNLACKHFPSNGYIDNYVAPSSS